MSAESLLNKIATGKDLTVTEADEVAQTLDSLRENDALRKRVAIDDQYSMLLCLGQYDAKKYKGVIAHYLECRDPQTTCLALKLLCETAAVRIEIIEQLLHFALGTSWDHDLDVQCYALEQLGEFIRDHKKGRTDADDFLVSQSASLLLNIFQDENESYQARKSAYLAMLRSAGRSWEEMPSQYKRIDLNKDSQDICPNVVAEINTICNS
ncbi:MAG: hypothetical protein PHC51_07960 [bacterium]|nr:hypothetical protein [bacterium]